MDRVKANFELPPEQIHQKIAGTLRDCRLQLKYSINDLAQLLNVKEDVIQRIEQKIAEEDYELALRLLRFYDSQSTPSSRGLSD